MPPSLMDYGTFNRMANTVKAKPRISDVPAQPREAEPAVIHTPAAVETKQPSSKGQFAVKSPQALHQLAAAKRSQAVPVVEKLGAHWAFLETHPAFTGLTPQRKEVFSRYVSLAAPQIAEVLKAVVKTPEFKQLPSSQQQAVFNLFVDYGIGLPRMVDWATHPISGAVHTDGHAPKTDVRPSGLPQLHMFSNFDSVPEASPHGFAQTFQIGEQQLPILTADSSEPSQSALTPHEVAQAMGELPPAVQAMVHGIRIEPRKAALALEEWREVLASPNSLWSALNQLPGKLAGVVQTELTHRFPEAIEKADLSSADVLATADIDGLITIYPTSQKPSHQELVTALAHEIAHTMSGVARGEDEWTPRWRSWANATIADGVGASRYGLTNVFEGYAEMAALYLRVRDTPSEPLFEKTYPNQHQELKRDFRLLEGAYL